MEFTFDNYKRFCNDLNIKTCYYTSLKIFRKYCDGDFDVIFSIA